MRIAVTGAGGFIGTNLRVRLRELGHSDVVGIGRASSREELVAALADCVFLFHLAGINRAASDDDFLSGNVGFTEDLCKILAMAGRPIPVAYASSTQATRESIYGRSKLAAERALLAYGSETGSPVHLFRLTNVFGKWARASYNSAVATFCHNIARGLPITIHDPASPLRLIYIDDVVDAFVRLLDALRTDGGYVETGPVYETTVGELAGTIRGFAESRSSLVIPPVGSGLIRALYATYVSYLPPESLPYKVKSHSDPRGAFVEVLKTPASGQFSYFTAHPGVTRGEHYHHSKTEKFVVLKGTARFQFRQIETGETSELIVRGGEGEIVDTAPGWAHNITNVGEDELIVMLWANELFDKSRPDTVAMKVVA